MDQIEVSRIRNADLGPSGVGVEVEPSEHEDGLLPVLAGLKFTISTGDQIKYL